MRLLKQFNPQPNRNQVVRFAVSLLLATLLWGWVTQLQDPYVSEDTRFDDMQIQPGMLPESLQLVSTLSTANVTLEGSRSLIEETQRSEVTVSVDTSSVNGPGTFTVPVLVNSPDVSRKSVDPEELTIQVDERVTKIFPLTIQNASEPDASRLVDNVAPEVSQVTVSGPSSAVDRVAAVFLPITVEQQVSDYDALFSPYAADDSGQQIMEVEILPTEIRTRVGVQTRGKSVSVIPNITGVPAEGLTITQRQAVPDTIVVDGPPEVLDDLLFVNTEPIDVADVTESFSTRVGFADLPSGVTVIDPIEETVDVRIAVEDTSTSSQTLSSLPVEAIGLNPNLAATFDPSTVSIQVTAPVELLQVMDAEDITILVDLTGLDAGTHVLQPEVTVPQGATWLSNEPGVVTVTIAPSEGFQGTPVSSTPAPPSSEGGLPQSLMRAAER